jgi:hypothetical protein
MPYEFADYPVDDPADNYVPDEPSGYVPGDDYSIDNPANYPRSETNPGGYDPSASYNQPLSNLSGVLGSYKKLFEKIKSGQAGATEYAAAAGILGLLMPSLNQPKTKGWKGSIDLNRQFTRTPIAQPAYTPYAQSASPVMGRQFFNSTYGAAPAAPPPTTPPVNETISGGMDSLPKMTMDDPYVNPDLQAAGAAEGGLMGYARGGKAMPPRYLRGQTDGMADKIPSDIDGVQPAKLSHGEFVIPADVVSHLGNGNSDAGAKVLYKMMNRVRHARTGNKKQGRQINPEKFTPGGIAGYAGGGAVAFQTGGVTGSVNPNQAISNEQNISEWAGPYVGDMLSKTSALTNTPYQAYQGPLSAGTSPLQQQAFTGLSNLQTPSQFGMATNLATQAGQRAGELSNYTPSSFSAPGVGTSNVSSTYQAPTAYQAGTFDAGFKAPTPFQAGTFSTGYTPGQFSTGLGAIGSVKDYMSPYQQNVIDIQAREARRQGDISRGAEQARLAQAGAYGGSRQAIMEAERQRNLGTQIGDIQEKGLQSAYDRALAQRMQEAQLGLQAQQFGEQARQFGTTTGLQAQQFGEQSRQFGSQQALSAAQLASQFGLDAQKAMELSRQFGYGQQMTANQLQAQFGLDAQKANQIAQLQASTANQRAAMESQQMAEQSKQFGANLGLQGLSQQLAAAGQLGSLGTQQFGTELQGLGALLNAGTQQRGIEQEGIAALQRQYETELLDPFTKLRFQREMLQGLPVATASTTANQSTMGQLGSGFENIGKLMKELGIS